MNDLISRQAAIDAICEECHMETDYHRCEGYKKDSRWCEYSTALNDLPSAQTEPHYCRECKWSWCHINVDKHGKSETYWRCLNWDGETDEEGYCHEWERRTDG